MWTAAIGHTWFVELVRGNSNLGSLRDSNCCEQAANQARNVGLEILVGPFVQKAGDPCRPDAVCLGKVLFENANGVFRLWVDGDCLQAVDGVVSILEDVPEVIRILVFATAPERKCLEDNERSRTADSYRSRCLPTGQHFALDPDFFEVLERQVESGSDHRREVALEILEVPALFLCRRRLNQKVDENALAEVPPLGRGIAFSIHVSRESRLPEPPGNLLVLLLVEDGERQAQIEIVGADMGLRSRGQPGDVDQEAWDQSANDAKIVLESFNLVATSRQASRIRAVRFLS